MTSIEEVSSPPPFSHQKAASNTATAAATTDTHDATVQAEDDNAHSHCLVCYSDLTHPTILPCGHNHVCGTCHLRLRHLHSDTKCPMCKSAHPQVIVDSAATAAQKSFEDYPLWGNELGPDFVYKQDVGMFFPINYYQQEIEPLFGYQCHECDEYDGTTPDENIYESTASQQQQQQRSSRRRNNKPPPTPLRALQDHLRNKHRMALCQLCVDHKRDFVSQLPRYTPSQLQQHLQMGDKRNKSSSRKAKSHNNNNNNIDDGSRGHPLCEFCRPRRFYDLTELHAHLRKDHYKCHLCERQGMPNQYFSNYDSLQHHFSVRHFLCSDPQCLAARFVVFDNEIDLRAHELSTHGASRGGAGGGSTKIQLEFRYRRSSADAQNDHDGAQNEPLSSRDFDYTVNGQAFVPEELPPSTTGNDNAQAVSAAVPNQDISHPLHLQRTNQLRAQAAQIRQERDMQEAPEAFPSLVQEQAGAGDQHGGGGGNATTALRVGWSSQGTNNIGRRSNQMAPENFPSLSSTTTIATSANKKNSVRAKLTKSNRQFAAMKSAAEQGPSTNTSSSGWIGASGAGAASSTSLFPSLQSSSTTTAPSLRPSSTRTAAQATSSSARSNRQANLTQDNFPSLGGTSSSTGVRYSAADNLARKQKATATPSLKSTTDFPPPPSSSAKRAASSSVRQQVLGTASSSTEKAPAVHNVLDFPPPPSSDHVTTIDDIKATLGTGKYKQLRKLTKEFAADAIAPDAYIDHAASLFERGYADSDFWSFLPTLLGSCPNTSTANRAQRYMEDLRRNIASSSLPTTGNNSKDNGGWSSEPTIAAAIAATPRAPSGGTKTSSWSAKPTAPPTKRPPGSKTSAWSGSSSSTVARAKQKPGSVTAAAQQAQSQKGSTATKFMAKEAKASKKQETKKAKKKQNDELRALAFGGK